MTQSQATESGFERQLAAGWGDRDGKVSPASRQLHFREGANLCFQSLVVLPFDLKFRLQLFDQQIQMGNLHAQFLDVGGSRSWPNRRGIHTLRILRRVKRLSWREGLR